MANVPTIDSITLIGIAPNILDVIVQIGDERKRLAICNSLQSHQLSKLVGKTVNDASELLAQLNVENLLYLEY